MDPRYATFIWVSFGIAAIAVVWNVMTPYLARNKLKTRLSEATEDEPSSEDQY